MPGRLVHSVRMVNVVSLVLFLLCCYHSLTVHSDTSPDGAGALTVVPQDEESDSNGVTVEVEGENGQEDDEPFNPFNVFYPTKDWQPVKPGQAVPKGLHVRLNLETGEREAKLMDGDDGIKYWKEGGKEGMINPSKKRFSPDELKQALKDFKTQKIDEPDPERVAEIKNSFRSYEELREDFKKLNMNIKTEAEIVTELYNNLRTVGEDVEKKLLILTDLEYYLHQVDNALVFSDLGGLNLLVKALNSSEERIQSEAAVVLGAAVQSNPKVQIAAVEAGTVQILIRLMSTHSSLNLRKKIIFAVSSFIRHFPYAQKKFLDLGGLSALGKLFSERGSEKLSVKAVTLINDLVVERDNILAHADSANKEQIRQYEEVHLRDAINEQGWCEQIPALLEVPEHDAREKILSAMKTLKDPCQNSFSRAESVLKRLKDEYKVLAEEESQEEDKYFTHVFDSVQSVIAMLNIKDEL